MAKSPEERQRHVAKAIANALTDGQPGTPFEEKGVTIVHAYPRPSILRFLDEIGDEWTVTVQWRGPPVGDP